MAESKEKAWREEIARLAEKGGATTWAVSLHDFTDGSDLELNGDRRFHAASTIKVAILLALFQAVDQIVISKTLGGY